MKYLITAKFKMGKSEKEVTSIVENLDLFIKAPRSTVMEIKFTDTKYIFNCFKEELEFISIDQIKNSY